ncbi:hypothetical protein FNO01nite_14770 [Flavobacterium noncentrifugens]|uniref:Uncharacterized protein n=1 Tax=Flavobacterium noncentrifugens TaxID=1128970 RepID=A0A1G8W942_9FLAO|nr:DUF6428 family protein [Flavobacterium noncentrifugens]GEP50805.1 hypothetical protein FNO01nite_14770 [Flavobacterium noncentrifugens]SDJ74255.1 hypothetical protein SAMN04487935_1687 [Flavobacterium noncentrifugens]
MKLSEIKQILETAETVNFKLENGTFVPEHFHVTEVGMVSKHFIDCGGKVRKEKVANFQLWDATDFEHRLKPGKLQKIIALSEKVLEIEDLEIEVEYQFGTIGKYDLGFDGYNFILLTKQTACLAKESCGTPRQKFQLSALETSYCAPDGNC